MRTFNVAKSNKKALFICRAEYVSANEKVSLGEMGNGRGMDLTMLDPVIYSDDYHALGKNLGTIGDFLE